MMVIMIMITKMMTVIMEMKIFNKNDDGDKGLFTNDVITRGGGGG